MILIDEHRKIVEKECDKQTYDTFRRISDHIFSLRLLPADLGALVLIHMPAASIFCRDRTEAPMKNKKPDQTKTGSCRHCGDGKSDEFWKIQFSVCAIKDKNWRKAKMIGVFCKSCKKLCIFKISKISNEGFVSGVCWSVPAGTVKYKPGTFIIDRGMAPE